MSVLGPSPAPRKPWRPFVAGLAAGAVIIGLVFAGVLLTRGGSDQSAGQSGAATASGRHAQAAIVDSSASAQSSAQSSGQSSAQSSPSVDGCAQLVAAQRPALQAAKASLAQWHVHVGAMNQLVAGQITLAQANQFWAHTRLGAHSLLDRYFTARDNLRAHAPQCPPGSPCAAAADARTQVLRIADQALATWKGHVHHMEMLRMGMMTPAQATQMWVASWHTGVRQLGAYHAAVSVARGLHCG